MREHTKNANENSFHCLIMEFRSERQCRPHQRPPTAITRPHPRPPQSPRIFRIRFWFVFCVSFFINIIVVFILLLFIILFILLLCVCVMNAGMKFHSSVEYASCEVGVVMNCFRGVEVMVQHLLEEVNVRVQRLSGRARATLTRPFGVTN